MANHTTIVAADDFSAPGLAAIRAGLDLARRLSGELHLVHVLTERELDAAPGNTRLERQDALLQKLPSQLWDRVGLAGASVAGLAELHVTVHVRLGQPAEEIDRAAADFEGDFIVVGTASKRGLERLVLGSVAEKLMRSAHCPVLVVRERDFQTVERSDRPEAPVPGEDMHKQRPEPRHVYRSSQIFSFGDSETHGAGR